MDVHASHKTDEVLESLKLMNVKPVYVDPGLTCKCQVMDVAGNKGFKHSVGKRHREWRRENPTTRVDRNMVMEWGCLAHYDVPSEGIKKAVEKHILVLQKSAEGVEPANDGHSAEEIAKYTAAYLVTLEDTNGTRDPRPERRKPAARVMGSIWGSVPTLSREVSAAVRGTICSARQRHQGTASAVPSVGVYVAAVGRPQGT